MLSMDILQGLFVPNFGKKAASAVLSFTDLPDFTTEGLPVSEFKISTYSFFHFLVKSFILYFPIVILAGFLYGFSKLLKLMIGVKTIGKKLFIHHAISNFLFFNFPIRLLLQLELTLAISAFFDIDSYFDRSEKRNLSTYSSGWAAFSILLSFGFLLILPLALIGIALLSFLSTKSKRTSEVHESLS